MSDPLMRAQMLLSQGRFDLAEQELRRLLSQEPDDATAHAMLAICLVQDERRFDEATDEAEHAIVLEPDNSFIHFVRSIVRYRRNHFPEAMESIEEAIRLDPYDADYFGQRAAIFLAQRNWQSSLDSASVGLSIDAEHAGCNNARAIALERLGRSSEAITAAAENLSRSPDDSSAHSAMGWSLLSGGRHREAQQAFREALRLDPHDEMARDGMITALNSRSFLFRIFNQFHLFLSRLSRQCQFGLIFGAWILVNLLNSFGRGIPWLRPFIPLVVMFYIAFVIMTWISDALFNTILRCHPFGRHLLNRKEIWSSNFVATCFFSGLVGSVYATFRLGLLSGIVTGYYWMLMCVPATIPFRMPTAARAWLMGCAGIFIGLIPVYGVAMSTIATDTYPLVKAMTIFNWSILGYQIASNFIALAPNRK